MWMGISTMVIGKMTKQMDMAHISMSTEPGTKAIGRMISSMVMELKRGQMVPNMMDTTKKVKNTETAHIFGQMDRNTAAIGRTTKYQELV